MYCELFCTVVIRSMLFYSVYTSVLYSHSGTSPWPISFYGSVNLASSITTSILLHFGILNFWNQMYLLCQLNQILILPLFSRHLLVLGHMLSHAPPANIQVKI